jgi:hypothetical protein
MSWKVDRLLIPEEELWSMESANKDNDNEHNNKQQNKLNVDPRIQWILTGFLSVIFMLC